ncbi:MAG: hypothetical protein GNW80_15645, partial [Asgard group archaeon]|nr:hypothetical protein [Asgard group archaeon]
MAVIEAGLIVNGMPIIRSVYYPDEKEVDPFIRTGLFTAIQTFASKAFDDEAEEMKLKRYSLIIKDLDPGSNEQLLLYSVAEKGTDVSEVKKRLANLEKKLDLDRVILDSPVMTSELKQIKKMIDKELKDLCLKPADRAKGVFG